MRKVLLLVALMALTAGSVAAQPPTAYIGIWWDNTRTSYCATVPAPFTMLTFWAFVLPSVNGVKCAEFRIDISNAPGLMLLTATNNPAVSVALGDPASGISVCFTDCQTDWVWAFNMGALASTTNAGYIQIVENPNVGPPPAYQVASCLEGYPIETVIRFTHAYINTEPCPAVGVTSTTWGGIKALYSN